MSKQMRQLIEAIEAERYEKETLRLLDEVYEQEQLDRDAQEYGYGNYIKSRNNYEMYIAAEYSYLTA